MVDLPELPHDDSRNLLRSSFKKRLQRAYVEASKIIWEAEALIDAKSFSRATRKAKFERNQARLRAARMVLAILFDEYGKLGLPTEVFESSMQREIDSVANSFELFASQRKLLKLDFLTIEEGNRVNPPSETTDPGLEQKQETCTRSREVDAFIRRCNQLSTTRIYKRHIWKSVRHKTARQFEYWQACNEKATLEDQRNFSRILNDNPEKFVAALKRQELIPQD